MTAPDAQPAQEPSRRGRGCGPGRARVKEPPYPTTPSPPARHPAVGGDGAGALSPRGRRRRRRRRAGAPQAAPRAEPDLRRRGARPPRVAPPRGRRGARRRPLGERPRLEQSHPRRRPAHRRGAAVGQGAPLAGPVRLRRRAGGGRRLGRRARHHPLRPRAGPERGHAPRLSAGPAPGPGRRAGAHRGRDRRRQRVARRVAPRGLASRRRPLRRARLLHRAGRAARVDPVRPRAGRLHRRRAAARGRLRAGPRRHALHRRDWRPRARGAVAPLAGARARRGAARRRPAPRLRRRARHRRHLEKEIEVGRFRDDRFHRLAVTRLELPPLRERPGAVELLARAFWQHLGGEASLPAAWLACAVAAPRGSCATPSRAWPPSAPPPRCPSRSRPRPPTPSSASPREASPSPPRAGAGRVRARWSSSSSTRGVGCWAGPESPSP